MKLTKIPETIQRSLVSLLAAHPIFSSILADIAAQGGSALLVGGAVRDLFLGRQIKDIDIELHNLSREQLETILYAYGPVDYIGKAYGVYRVHPLAVDWSLPRTDEPGRKPVVRIDPLLNTQEAFRRRDLTINALGIDLVTHELIDPFGGLSDLEQKVLRATDEQRFVEDPLRFYRVMQFVGRFEMMPDSLLNQICQEVDLQGVSVERIESEFEKLFLQSVLPSLGIRWLFSIGRLRDVLPELADVAEVRQDPKWHPEGPVFEHTMQALDAAASLVYADEKKKLIIMYAVLCHDLGKFLATYEEGGRIRSTGHARMGVPLARQLLKRITKNKELIESALLLVKYHMEPVQFVEGGAKPAAYKRLAAKLAPQVTLHMLADLARADKLARNPIPGSLCAGEVPEVSLFLKRANESAVLEQKEAPLLQGKDLLDLVAPGPELGKLLLRAYEIQLEEGVSDKKELRERLLAEHISNHESR